MLLALNTATPHCALALLEGGNVLAEAGIGVANSHSEAVFVLLQALFAWSGKSKSDLRALAVATGPGGFTGLRTGLTLAKTLAQVLKVPVYGVDTLSAQALGVVTNGLVSPMLDARRNMVFAGLMQPQGKGLISQIEGALFPFETWLATLQEIGQPIIACGEGATTHRSALEAAGISVPPDALMLASAVNVGLLALERLVSGAPSELAHLEPRYLREPQAVVNWEALQAAKKEPHDACS